jgi:hypothetical protein
MHQFGRGYEIFVTNKFPTSHRTSDVRRYEMLCYAVLCNLLIAKLNLLNTAMLSHAPSTFIKTDIGL